MEDYSRYNCRNLCQFRLDLLSAAKHYLRKKSAKEKKDYAKEIKDPRDKNPNKN